MNAAVHFFYQNLYSRHHISHKEVYHIILKLFRLKIHPICDLLHIPSPGCPTHPISCMSIDPILCMTYLLHVPYPVSIQSPACSTHRISCMPLIPSISCILNTFRLLHAPHPTSCTTYKSKPPTACPKY